MPAFRELPLLVWCIGRGDDERGTVAQVRIGAVEPVRPQRAIGTALAHVVDDEQIGLVAEQLGEPHAPAARTALREWAYATAFEHSEQRYAALPAWLHRYNWHRPHVSLARKPPISRLGLTGDNLLSLHS